MRASELKPISLTRRSKASGQNTDDKRQKSREAVYDEFGLAATANQPLTDRHANIELSD